MFLYARIYWLAEFGDVSFLQFNYLRVETLTPTWDTLTLILTPTWEDFVGRFCRTFVGRFCRTFCRTILRVTLSSSPTKLCVRPESMIVYSLGGICTLSAQVGVPMYTLPRWYPNEFSSSSNKRSCTKILYK